MKQLVGSGLLLLLVISCAESGPSPGGLAGRGGSSGSAGTTGHRPAPPGMAGTTGSAGTGVAGNHRRRRDDGRGRNDGRAPGRPGGGSGGNAGVAGRAGASGTTGAAAAAAAVAVRAAGGQRRGGRRRRGTARRERRRGGGRGGGTGAAAVNQDASVRRMARGRLRDGGTTFMPCPTTRRDRLRGAAARRLDHRGLSPFGRKRRVPRRAVSPSRARRQERHLRRDADERADHRREPDVSQASRRSRRLHHRGRRPGRDRGQRHRHRDLHVPSPHRAADDRDQRHQRQHQRLDRAHAARAAHRRDHRRRAAALVVVATIIPIANDGTNQRIPNYNAAIPGLVASRAAAGKHVVLRRQLRGVRRATRTSGRR